MDNKTYGIIETDILAGIGELDKNEDSESLIDFSDWATNNLRACARNGEFIYKGEALRSSDLLFLIGMEHARIKASGKFGLKEYLKLHRGGAKIRLKRSHRKLIWTWLKVREIFNIALPATA